MLHTLMVVVQIIAAIGVIVLVLLQHGKGADAGASFGSGASQTVFGSAGSGNFLTHSTAIFALIFFVASLTLAHLNSKAAATRGQLNFDNVLAPAASPAPASDLPALPQAPAATGDLPIVDQAAKQDASQQQSVPSAAITNAAKTEPSVVSSLQPIPQSTSKP